MKRNPSIGSAALACAAALAVAQVNAQDSATASADKLAGFVGDGVCSGVMATGKNASGGTTGRFHAEKALDGHWIEIRYEQDASASNPKPFKVKQYLGYDPASKQFTTVMLGNGDGVYSVGKSPGWQGDTITFEEVETARGQAGQTREAFSTHGSGLSGYTGWFRDKSGKWIKVDEEHCKPS